MRLLGLDPGLRHTGWGVIDVAGNRLRYVADGVAHARAGRPLAERLVELFRAVGEVLDRFLPDAAAVEETFVNKNPASTLKLGVARGVVLLAPAERGLPVFEYSANLIKKSVVGVGHADKAQVQLMVRRLLPGCEISSPDAADALAVAICHAHHAATQRVWSNPPLPSGEREGVRGSRQRSSSPAAPPHPPAHAGPSLSPKGRGDLQREARRKPTELETTRARRLRRDQTDAERILWRALRSHQIDNIKFRRQEPILGFFADFVCHERRLIIELDGGQHADKSEAGTRRTRFLEQAGFRVLRFWNNDVMENLEGVISTIQTSLEEASL